MSSMTHSVDKYHYSKNDRLFFDANIWVLLYGPQYNPDDPRVPVYSAALRDILTAKCNIFIDVLVLSEFINRWARFRYNLISKERRPKYFKQFRNSADFPRVAQETAVACRKIMDISLPISDCFETINISELLGNYESGKYDFNDQVLASLCRTRELKLVTDDGDFARQEITILTANRRLLNR